MAIIEVRKGFRYLVILGIYTPQYLVDQRWHFYFDFPFSGISIIIAFSSEHGVKEFFNS